MFTCGTSTDTYVRTHACVHISNAHANPQFYLRTFNTYRCVFTCVGWSAFRRAFMAFVCACALARTYVRTHVYA